MKSFAALILLSATALSRAQVIYNQTNHARGTAVWMHSADTEYGDEVTFAAGPRKVTEISIPLLLSPSGNQNPTLTATIVIRNMVSGVPSATPLWTGTITLTPHGTLGTVTSFNATVTVPSVTVPNTAYIGISLADADNGPAWVGFGQGAAAAVGSSSTSYLWSYHKGVFHQETIAAGNNNMHMRVTAVP